MALSVIPTLLHGVLYADTAKRHGSILAIAELVLALTKLGKEIDPLIVSQIRYKTDKEKLNKRQSIKDIKDTCY